MIITTKRVQDHGFTRPKLRPRLTFDAAERGQLMVQLPSMSQAAPADLGRYALSEYTKVIAKKIVTKSSLKIHSL
jgi:hypothetical protein